ncbi:MAG: hypothetical protein K1Y36_03455 [Blastocatellia bacterium]|nr:hypothetical protein [Blastocatellia bacterium]
MKLFAFLRGRGSSDARLIRVEAGELNGHLSTAVRCEMRERLRELVGKAEQKRQLRNLHGFPPLVMQGMTNGREHSDEGDSRCLVLG